MSVDLPGQSEGVTSESTNEDGNRCPECAGKLVEDADVGELFCGDCGLVTNECVPSAPSTDHVAQASNQDVTQWQRQAGSRVMYDKGLGSTIGYSTNRGETTANGDLKKRLQRAESRSAGYDDSGSDKGRTLIPGLWEIQRLADRLGVPGVVRKEAAGFLQTASEEDLLGKPGVEAFSAACIYAGAYIHRRPQTYKMIAEQTDCDQQEIESAHSQLKTKGAIPLGFLPNCERWPRYEPVPWDLVDRFAALVAVELDEAEKGEQDPQAELMIHGRALLQKALERDEMLANRSSKGLAAGAVYVAGRFVSLPVTQAMASNATSVSQSTVNDIANRLQDALE